ncbi:MAG TPA: hypothetical protein VGP76_20295 [Planctomycetaceae bacterium]|jgi:hypothetical protein|nr:hypothetical protein [Planctomycetaceae bacterium]
MLAPTPREFDRLVPRAVRSPQSLGRAALAVAMVLGLIIWFAGSVRAGDDDDDPEDDMPVRKRATPASKESSDSSSGSNGSSPITPGTPSDGFGVDFIPGFSYGQGVIQDKSLAPIEAFPYFLVNDSLYFSDLRFYPTIDGTFGGSLGGGYRYFSHGLNRIFGASLWYDGDGTRDLYFQQIGLSLETYGFIDFRTNLYFPVGQTSQQSGQSIVNGSQRFTGNNLAFDTLTTYLAAMRGVDFEAGVGIPGHFAEDHGIRAYLGGYYYDDDEGDHILGISGRVQANIWSGLDAAVQVTNDNYFNTRAFVNVSWTFGPLHRSQLSQATTEGRLGEKVVRNYTVLATSQSHLDDPIAFNPSTHQPYVIAHVDSSAAPGGNGSVNSPFQTIAAAQASGATVIFVHAGSVFNGSASNVVMNSGEFLFGDGTGERNFLPISTYGQILLPHGPTTGALPVLNSSTGTAVTLANNSVLSGFTISNPAGVGVLANGVGGITIKDVMVTGAGSDGIQILNASANSVLTNVNVMNSLGNGLVINGGDSNVQYSGNLVGNQQHDLVIENIGTDSVMNMTNAMFPGSGSQGILLSNIGGTVNFNNLSLGNTSSTGVDIEGGTGRFNFTGQTTVSGAGAASILVNGLEPSGVVTFGTLGINNRHDEGLVVNNSSGNVFVNGVTTITNEGGTGASAIDIKNSSGNVTFLSKVNVVNSTVNPGISITNDTGTTSFTSLNVSSVNGTGLFANNGGALVINGAQVAAAGGTILATNGTAVDIENTTMNIYLFSVSSSNAAVGIKLLNAQGAFAVFGNSNETAGAGGTIQGDTIGIQAVNSGAVGLLSMNLNGNGTGIQAQDLVNLSLTNVNVTNSSSFGINALDTKTIVVLSSNFSGNGGPNVATSVDTTGSYAFSFLANRFTSTTSDNIQVTTLSGGQGATVNLVAQGNQFQNESVGTAGINVNWNGTLSATVTQNEFLTSGGSNTGVKINNGATNALSTIAFTNNTFGSEGGSDTALNVVLAGTGQINVASNGIQFAADTGTAFHFSLGAASTVNVTGNTIIDTTDGATAMQFDTIAASSNLAVSGNTIQLSQNGAELTSGIIISNVTGTTQGSQNFFLNLSSASNNTISGANTLFFAPTNTTAGEVLINGSPMP